MIGFGLLIALVAPAHLGTGGALTVGVGVTAYTLGLRHAFDADHITAIDNTTRKLMAEGRRPLSVGFWFSLGHSTIVFALAVLISTGMRALERTGDQRRFAPPSGHDDGRDAGVRVASSTSSPRSTW